MYATNRKSLRAQGIMGTRDNGNRLWFTALSLDLVYSLLYLTRMAIYG